MPLNGAQKEFIKATVEHFFYNLPTDEKKLSNEILRIQNAFNGKLDSKDSDYKLLQDCIYQPSTCFHRLDEMSNERITPNEIKLEILTIANEAISSVIKKNNLSLVIWNIEELKTTLNNDDKQLFVSIKPRTHHGDHPYQLPHIPGQTYTAWSFPNEEVQMVDVRVEMNLKPPKKISFTEHLMPLPDFKNDADQDHFFINTVANDAKDCAEDGVIRHTLKHLYDHKKITKEELNETKFPGAELLLYQVYNEAIAAKKISLKAIYELSEQQVTTLTHPKIMQRIADGKETFASCRDMAAEDLELHQHSVFQQLLDEKKCDKDTLKNLTLHQKEVITHPSYAPRLLSGSLKIDDVKTLLSEECKNLMYPPALFLEAKKVINFQQIKSMTEGTKKIIADEFYQQLLVKNELEYKDIDPIDTKKAERLLEPDIQKAIADKQLTVSLINIFIPSANYNTIRLLEKRVINRREASQLNYKAIILLNSDAFIRYLLSQDMIYPYEINQIYIDPSILDFSRKSFVDYKVNDEYREQFQLIFMDFLKLTKANLLSDEDLFQIFKQTPLIYMQIASDFKQDEKNSNSDLALLRCKRIKDKCIKNAIYRTTQVLENTPIDLDSELGTKDSLNNIIKNCEIFNIPFSEVRDIAYSAKIKYWYTHPYNQTFKQMLDTGKNLGFTKLESYERLLGVRLFTLYANRPYLILGEEDSIQKLKLSIKYYAAEERIPEEKLYQATLKFFLIQLKQEIDPFVTNTSKEFPDILNPILKAERDSNEEKQETNRYPIWAQAFEKIMKISIEKSRAVTIHLPPVRDLKQTPPEEYLPKMYIINPLDVYQKIQRIKEYLSPSSYPGAQPFSRMRV